MSEPSASIQSEARRPPSRIHGACDSRLGISKEFHGGHDGSRTTFLKCPLRSDGRKTCMCAMPLPRAPMIPLPKLTV